MFTLKLAILVAFVGCVATDSDASEAENMDGCTVVRRCHACNEQEILNIKECKKTGFVETVKCEASTSARSCVGGMDAEVAAFWRFEAAMIVTSLLSCALVMLRMRKLDRENMERIQRQISAL